MPVVAVHHGSQQQRLREHRRLLSPAEAARHLGISRQAIDKAALRDDGPYLIWRFVTPGARDLRRVDFGASLEPPDPRAWSAGEAPEDLLEEPPPKGPAPVSAEAETLLHMVASGVIELLDGREQRSVLPYPRPLQRSLDRITVLSWRNGRQPPVGVPALVGLCTRPVREWLPELPEIAATSADTLLANGMPTTFCREWAVPAQDVEGELFENRLMRGAISICRSRGAQQAYVTFRQLLIQCPVLSALDLQRYCANPEIHFLSDFLREAYAAVPLEHTIQDHALCCRACGHLIVTGARQRQCSNDRCPSADSPQVGDKLLTSSDPMWLRAPLRTFVSLPGTAELRLADQLRRLALRVELWPSYDAYDIRVTFDDGAVWAVDLKDWASPVALARHLSAGHPFRADSPWQRAFFVFPDNRLRANPEYLRVFRYFYRPDGANVPTVSESGFLRHLRNRIADPRSDTNA